MSVLIECPSGLQLRVRGLKGKEGKLLADKTAIRQGTVLDQMLVACTEEIVDPGPYSLSDGKLNWSSVLLGDRFYTLLQIRIASFGSEYGFKAQCRDGMCRERFEYQIDLASDLEVKRMRAEDREVFKNEGVFHTTLSDGTEVKYRLATGADEKVAVRSRTVDRALVDMLALRIQQIGELQSKNGGQLKIRNYLDELEWKDLVSILSALDEHDCGVETEIEIQCPVCAGVQEVQLPFERSFFLPMEKPGLRV